MTESWRIIHLASGPWPAASTLGDAIPVDVDAIRTCDLPRRRAHPDLVVFGMLPPVAAAYLNELARRIQDGTRYDGARVLHDLHPHYRFATVPITDPATLTRLAVSDEPPGAGEVTGPGPMLQLVWPDICGTLPWEFGYDPSTSGLRQPLLGAWPGRQAAA